MAPQALMFVIMFDDKFVYILCVLMLVVFNLTLEYEIYMHHIGERAP